MYDLAGKRFGRWLAVHRGTNSAAGHLRWRCVCDCGAIRDVTSGALRGGASKSCGCFTRDVNAGRMTLHGMTDSAEHRIWNNMLQRCTNPKDPRYASYGGRGISVCPRWLEFSAFYEDMGPRPEKHSVERVDNSKGYSPENCRWASNSEQCRNTRRNFMVAFRGETKPLVVWCEYLGLPYHKTHKRLKTLGWPAERALATK